MIHFDQMLKNQIQKQSSQNLKIRLDVETILRNDLLKQAEDLKALLSRTTHGKRALSTYESEGYVGNNNRISK